jgi:hypothetical protein
MTKDDIANYIRTRKRAKDSIEDQIVIAHALWNENIGPAEAGLKRKEIVPRLGISLDYRPRTSLKHLADIDVIEEYRRPGAPNSYVIATWKSKGIINGEVAESARDGIEAVIDHMQATDPRTGISAFADGGTGPVRSAVAAALDVSPKMTEQALRNGDWVRQLNSAVEAIETHSGINTRSNYGKIVFRTPPYRYRLTKRAVMLYQ